MELPVNYKAGGAAFRRSDLGGAASFMILVKGASFGLIAAESSIHGSNATSVD